jgi:putative FmdB family regulatory protein
MPTYDYECRECGHTFEQFQSITAGALRKCPECGRLKLRRLIGAGAGIIFKGSGFYETDYKRKSGATGKAGTAASSADQKVEKAKDATKKVEKAKSDEGGAKKKAS